jgi:hypothetical protein
MLSNLKSLGSKILAAAKTDIADIWKKDKAFLIAFGLIVLALKFRDILVYLIVSNSKQLFDKTRKQGDLLQGQEDANNFRVQKLQEQAKTLVNSDTKSDDNWYEK